MRRVVKYNYYLLLFISVWTSTARPHGRIMSSLKNKVNTETEHSKRSRKKTYMQHKITAFSNIEILCALPIEMFQLPHVCREAINE